MVKPGRAVAGKVLGVGAAIGAVLIAAYVFRQSQAGAQIIESFKGAGAFGGQAILAPIEGLVTGVVQGAGSIGQTTAALGANFEAFKIAFGKADFASIIDGTYIQKYGGVLGGATAPGAAQTPNGATGDNTFTKTTIKDESPNDKSPARSNFVAPPPSQVFDLKKQLAATAQRIALTVQANKEGAFKTKSGQALSFGGFGSAKAQEEALQKAIAEQRGKNPQFFR